jgi:hypothetical protein
MYSSADSKARRANGVLIQCLVVAVIQTGAKYSEAAAQKDALSPGEGS